MFYRIACLLFLLLWAGEAMAAHPLITDDAGTQGTGKYLLEFGAEYVHKTREEKTEDTTMISPQLTAGVRENVDLILQLPYQSKRTKEGDETTTEDGITDTLIFVKWRFYEKDGFSLALKPGMTVPTGDDNKGRGAGRTTYLAYFIATKEIEPVAIHVNLGYRRNENRIDERRDIYYASIAGEWKVAKDLKLVLDTGIERNADKSSTVDPAFIMGGVIYSLTKSLDIDGGVRRWWNNLDKDYAVCACITWRF